MGAPTKLMTKGNRRQTGTLDSDTLNTFIVEFRQFNKAFPVSLSCFVHSRNVDKVCLELDDCLTLSS